MTKHVQVRLEDAEYAKFEGKARALGVSHQTVARELLTTWASPEGARRAFDDLTATEANVLHAVLDILRDESLDADDPRSVKPSLLALGRRWSKRNPARTK